MQEEEKKNLLLILLSADLIQLTEEEAELSRSVSCVGKDDSDAEDSIYNMRLEMRASEVLGQV